MAKRDLSVSWTDYSANISASFNDLLKQNELVDVTLVADNYKFDAHRLVLSALSPYFRRIFTQMPANQQAFGKYRYFFMPFCVCVKTWNENFNFFRIVH